jgi:hypothetical protein
MNQNISIKAAAICATAAVLLIPIFVFLYVRSEHPAYQWDWGAYWWTFQQYGQKIASGAGWMTDLRNSVRADDYNAFGVIPLYPFYRLHGGGRGVYVVAVALTYLLPAMLVVTWLAVTVTKVGGKSGTISAFVLAFLFVPFWVPTVRGYLDISGLIFLGLSTILVLKTNFLQRRVVVSTLVLGVLIWMPFLFRRWYAFSIVSFFCLTYLFALPLWWRSRGLAGILSITVALGFSGAIACVLVFLFQKDLAIRAATTSYSDLYSAYQVPLINHLQLLLSRTGWYMLCLIGAGVIVAGFARNGPALFCALLALMTGILFSSTQFMADHHFLPIAMWLFPLYFLALAKIADIISFPRYEVAGMAPALLMAAILFAGSFLPASVFSGLGSFGPAKAAPLHLDNYPEYQRLTHDLEKMLGKGQKFSVLSTANWLNDSLLVSLDPALLNSMSYSLQIDGTALVQTEALRADYIVVSLSGQPMLQSKQRALVVPLDKLKSKVAWGDAFEPIGATYNLSQGTTAQIYKRQRDISIAEMRGLVNEITADRPAWLRQHLSSMSLSFGARHQVLGDTWGNVSVAGPNAIAIHPGIDKPTTLLLAIGAEAGDKPKSVTLSIDISAKTICPDADGVGAIVSDGDGHELWTGSIEPGHSTAIDLDRGGTELIMSIDKGQRVGCDSTLVTFLY